MNKKTNSSRAHYEIPLLTAIYESGGAAKADDELYARVEAKLAISSEEKAYDKVHAKPKWVYELQWVRFTLRKKGELMASQRGIWQLSRRGLTRLKNEAPQMIASDQGEVARRLEHAWTVSPLEGHAEPDSGRIIYSMSTEDVEMVAEEELDRPLTEKEAKLVEDKLGDYVPWYDAILECIRDCIKA
jgi:restriction endonuclease Mrr